MQTEQMTKRNMKSNRDIVNDLKDCWNRLGSTTDIIHGYEWWIKSSSLVLNLEKEISNKHASALSRVCHGTKIGTPSICTSQCTCRFLSPFVLDISPSSFRSIAYHCLRYRLATREISLSSTSMSLRSKASLSSWVAFFIPALAALTFSLYFLYFISVLKAQSHQRKEIE